MRWALLVLLGGCTLFEGKLPRDNAPLHDMEEPLALHQEPDDEAKRRKLPKGVFTGIYAVDARLSLDEMDEAPESVLVERVVENSPADAAGLREGDLLFEVEWEGGSRALAWSSEWRELELKAKPGVVLRVRYDRAGVERTARITPVARLRAPPREEAQRFREEVRVGVAVRSATEVEARAAGLGPGGGAVIVGLSHASPLRTVGLRYGDVISEVNGKKVAHPTVLLEAIRESADDGRLALRFYRNGKPRTADAPVTRRAREIKSFSFLGLVGYEGTREHRELSLLFGLYKRESTPVAWEVRLFWLIHLRGGTADRLEEVDE